MATSRLLPHGLWERDRRRRKKRRRIRRIRRRRIRIRIRRRRRKKEEEEEEEEKEEEKAENGMEIKFDIYIEKVCKIKNVIALARFEYKG